MIDKPVGQIFKFKGKKYVAVITGYTLTKCDWCAFDFKKCINAVACFAVERTDKLEVVYKEVKEEQPCEQF